MKTDYLNNITTEATHYRNKYRVALRIKPSRLNHMMKLLNYRERAFNGKRVNFP